MSSFEHARFDEHGNLSLDIVQYRDDVLDRHLWFLLFGRKGNVVEDYSTITIDHSCCFIDKNGGIVVRGATVTADNAVVLEHGITFENCNLTRVRTNSCNISGGSFNRCFINDCMLENSPSIESSTLYSCNLSGAVFISFCDLMYCTLESVRSGYIRKSNLNMCCFKDVSMDDLNPGGTIFEPVFVDSNAGLGNCRVLSATSHADAAVEILSSLRSSSDDIGVYDVEDCAKHDDVNGAADYVYDKLDGSVSRNDIVNAINSGEALIGGIAIFRFIDGSFMTAAINFAAAKNELDSRVSEIMRTAAADIESKIRSIVGDDVYSGIVNNVPSNRRIPFVLYAATDRSRFADSISNIISGQSSGSTLDPFTPSTTSTGTLDAVIAAIASQGTQSDIVQTLVGSLQTTANDFIQNGYERNSETAPIKPRVREDGLYCAPCAASCINCQVDCAAGVIYDEQGGRHECDNGRDIGWFMGPGCTPRNFDCVAYSSECCTEF